MHKGRESQRSAVYRIRVEGHLDPRWSKWFEGFAITPQVDEGTLLTGAVPDQTVLHCLLAKIYDLSLPLVSVERVETGLP